MSMKFEDRTWENTSKWRKGWMVLIWLLVFWPAAWIIAISGRIYRKDKYAKNGVRPVSRFANVFIVVVVPIFVLAMLGLEATPQYAMSETPNSSPVSTNSNSHNSSSANIKVADYNSAHKRVCRRLTPSIVRVINNISAFQVEHIKVIDHKKAQFVSYDSADQTTNCTIDTILSDTSSAQFDVQIFPSKFHKNKIMIKVEAENQ